ncbi:MAG: hypothetical protein ACO1OK_04445 [Devosia sp.]
MHLPSKRHLVPVLAPVLALMLSASPALAWTLERNMLVEIATQTDVDDRFRFDVDCDLSTGEFWVQLTLDQSWAETSLQPDDRVEIAFSADGESFTTEAFSLVDDGGMVALSLGDWDDIEALQAVLSMLQTTTDTLAISLLDTEAQFPMAGFGEAFQTLVATCWG